MKSTTIYDMQKHKTLYETQVSTKQILITQINDMLFMFAGHAYNINIINDSKATFEFLGTLASDLGTITKPHTITLTVANTAGCIILQRNEHSVTVQAENVLSALQAAVDAQQAYNAYTIADDLATLLATKQGF